MKARLRAALLLGGPTLFLAWAFFWPLVSTMEAAWAPEAWRWVNGSYVRSGLRIALWQAVLGTLLTMVLAVPLAWFHHSRALRFGRLQMAIHAAPFVLPVFVVILGIQAVFGARGWLPLLPHVGPLGAVVIAHAYYNYGFAARLLHAALERRPTRLEDAARTLGAGPWRAVWRVTLPLLLPTAASVALLVFLFAFTSFGVVLFLGGGEIVTLETLLYENLRGAFRRIDRAAALAVLQLGLNALLLLGYAALRRRQVRLPRQVPRRRPSRRRDHVLATAFAVLGALPVLAVLQGAFRVSGGSRCLAAGAGAPAAVHDAGWTLEPWRALLDPGHPCRLLPSFDLGHTLQLTLGYAAASAIGALLLTVSLAYGTRMLGPWSRRMVEAAAALPLATSSLLIGLGYTITFGVAGFLDTWTGRMLIVMAHTLVAFPFAARVLLPSLDQHDVRLDEAARTLGASPWSVVRRVHLPLLAAPLAAALGLALAMSFGDFGASLLLMNDENRSLSVWIARHSGVAAFDPMVRAQADALASLLAVMTAAAYVLVERLRGVEWS